MYTKDAILYSLNMADQADDAIARNHRRRLTDIPDGEWRMPSSMGCGTLGFRRRTHARDAGRRRQSGGALGRDFRAGHGSHGGRRAVSGIRESPRHNMWSSGTAICNFWRIDDRGGSGQADAVAAERPGGALRDIREGAVDDRAASDGASWADHGCDPGGGAGYTCLNEGCRLAR